MRGVNDVRVLSIRSLAALGFGLVSIASLYALYACVQSPELTPTNPNYS